MTHWLLAATLVLGAESSDFVAVVCPDEFRATLAPWIAHRERQGERFQYFSNRQSPDEIRAEIIRAAAAARLTAIVLVGDATSDRTPQKIETPTFQRDAKVNVLWGSEPTLATDNPYADIDGDSLPDVPIGRLSADSPDQLATMIRKIIAYETRQPRGLWRRRVNFVAGVGGFGAVADNMVETVTKKVLTEGIPASYQTSMTYGSWRSPFCPDPRRFHETAVDRLNEGSVFWVYIGHGQRRYLDRVRTPEGTHHIFDTDDVRKIHCGGAAPIAVFLACYTGAFDEFRDCLGEELLRAPDGPVASFCGSRVTMPYAMAVMGHEMMQQYFVQRRDTLGEVILHAKRSMVRDLPANRRAADPTRYLIDSLATVVSPKPDLLREERDEHVALFNLLGDPLLRLQHPDQVSIATNDRTIAGNMLPIQGSSNIDGPCIVELVVRRDRLKNRFTARPNFDNRDTSLAAYSKTYEQANNRRLARAVATVRDGSFSIHLPVPRDAVGACNVRVFVEGDQKFALGSAPLYIERAPGK